MSSSHAWPSHVPGCFTLVLHTHLPWVNHHGKWPVGEEWLYQACAESYIPVFSTLQALAAQGYSDILTLGLTPILAAQLDDPYSLDGLYHWLGNFILRADEAARTPRSFRTYSHSLSARDLSHYGRYAYSLATDTMNRFESEYKHGFSPVIRKLVDNNTVELLSGPLTHSFQPLTHPLIREYSLSNGLYDTTLRLGSRPSGIWAPECAYTPGLEKLYHANNITHFMVDGPAFNNRTNLGRPVDNSPVVAFARNLEISYRVWSPTAGYPGHHAYRDFYTYDTNTGLKPTCVTGKNVSAAQKQVYNPQQAQHAAQYHIEDFVSTVRHKLVEEYDRTGRPAHIIAAFDTELFGHWWHEGPQWLHGIVTGFARAGIAMKSLRTALHQGYVGEPIQLANVSWGTGKDFHVWNGPQVADIVTLHKEITEIALCTIAKRQAFNTARDFINDQILRETLLALSSDWSFLITKETSENYARDRLYKHAHALREICYASEIGDEDLAFSLAQAWHKADNPFPQLDARTLKL